MCYYFLVFSSPSQGFISFCAFWSCGLVKGWCEVPSHWLSRVRLRQVLNPFFQLIKGVFVGVLFE